jgi:hypothetical protein
MCGLGYGLFARGFGESLNIGSNFRVNIDPGVGLYV